MNRNLFKLVFDPARGMTVPICEVAVAHGKQGSRTRRLGVTSAAVALGAGLLVSPAGAAPPRGTVPVAATSFVSYGGGRIASDVVTTTGRAMTIEQTSQRATFNWNSFDVATGSSVEFKQPSVSSVALNRIFDSKPSEIYGFVKANGQIYLVNNNGILFGNGAQVNVGGIIASSLNLSDATFQAGLDSLTTARAPAFMDDGSTAIAGSEIRVAAGAEIKSASGGSIMLFAPKVTNEGRLDATNGQVVLGGGHTVYMMQSDSYATRGWLVEVDPRFLLDSNGNRVKDSTTQKDIVVASGEVTNRAATPTPADEAATRAAIIENDAARAAIDADFKASIDAQKAQPTRNGSAYSDGVLARAAERLGEVMSRRGNVSMVGFAVNQLGRVSATTSIKANGSIFLKAQDSVVEASNANTAERAGALTLGQGSTTAVDIEPTYDVNGAEETQYRAETFNPSRIDLIGHTVHLQPNASVRAAGGEITVKAVKDPSKPTYLDASKPRNDSRVVLEAGASISAAGSAAVVVEGSRNQITADLFGVQLADSPLQRSGILYRKTVSYDLRRGIKVANTTDYEKLVPITVGERTATGGKVTIQSEGDILIAMGAGIDISGGWLAYQPTTLLNTYLYSERKRYDISDAPANVVYTRMETEERSLAGYVEGKDAGSVILNGASLVLDGTVKGGVNIGDYQRESGINTPLGGQLILGDASGGGRTEDPSYRLPKTEIREVVDGFVPNAGQTWLNTSLGDRGTTTLLSADLFAHGVSRFALYSNGAIDQKAAIDVGPGGAVSLLGSSVNVGNTINAPGGSIDIVSHKTGKVVADGSSLEAVVEIGGNVTVAQGSLLNVAGRWTNDLKDGTTAQVVNRGGSINLESAQDLLLSQGSVLDASAGAWLKGDGKLTQGSAGSITLRAAQSNNRDGKLDLAVATLQARGFSKGGKLTLVAPNLSIGGLAGSGFGLGTDFFTKGGFGAFDLTGIGSATLVAGTQLTLQAEGLIFAEDYRERSGSASIARSTEVAVLPPEVRLAADFTMRAVVGVASDSGS